MAMLAREAAFRRLEKGDFITRVSANFRLGTVYTKHCKTFEIIAPMIIDIGKNIGTVLANNYDKKLVTVGEAVTAIKQNLCITN